MLEEALTIKRLAWNTLYEGGIIPTKPVYKEIRGKITASGRQETERLQKDIGMRNWKILLQQLEMKYPKDHLIRIMGFGNELTRYAITPVKNTNEFAEKVIGLGARANLIVTLFDQFIDMGKSINSVLSESALEKMMKNHSSRNSFLYQFLNFKSKWILPLLVESYLNDLKTISPNIHHGIFKSMLSLIQIMYRAEINTVSVNQHSDRTLTRKAALPFVVMGLPIWLNKKTVNSAAYLSHFRWLYKLGMFFGAVDDIIDLEEDMNENHPNQFLMLRVQNQLSDLYWEKISRKLILDAEWITERWRTQTEKHPQKSEHVPEIFATCIVSWFGGESNYRG